MDSFIKKIFEGRAKDGGDKVVHLQFQKFGRGEFKNKAVICARKTGEKFSINTTSEFANEFVGMMAEKIGGGKALVTGAIITTIDLSGEIEFKGKKQFMGVKHYVIESEMSGKEILSLLEKFPLCFFALSFSAEGSELKIKAKSPKSAKPSTKADEKPKPNFCKLTTTDISMARAILFDIDTSTMKKAEISHNFTITDIILPNDERDFTRMRELAKRKGVIERIVETGGRQKKTSAEFLA